MKIINDFQPGSLEWAKARCGKITMSHAKELLTGGKGKTRQSYIFDVVSEQLSGESIEGYYSVDMQRGNFLEEWAVKAFTKATGIKVDPVGFVLHDDERIGCTPDGLIDADAGFEAKCPKPRQHIRNIYGNGFDDYYQQCQGNMLVCQRKVWYLASFCPWVKQYPLHVERIERDEALIERLEKSAIDAADTVDSLVAQSQNITMTEAIGDLAEQARAAWENTLADNSEVRL